MNTQAVLFRLVTALLLLSRAPTALAVKDKENDRHDRDDEDRDINDKDGDTEFTCNVLDGEFRDTTGPYAVLTYAYEMEYLNGKDPINLASRVTNYISKGVIANVFEGCKVFDDRRRIQEAPLSISNTSTNMGRSLPGIGNDMIVGFETTPEVKPARGRECDKQPLSRDHECMVFSGGITIYFPDNKRKRKRERRRMQGEMDFGGGFSDEDHAIQEISHMIRNTIKYGKISQKVSGIQNLTYRILPVTDEPTEMPSAQPSPASTDKPSASPIVQETSRNEVIVATSKEIPIENKGGGALTISLLVISMLVCSIVGAIYIKKRREIKKSREEQEQAQAEMEAKDVLLNTYVPTAEMIRPLATDQGVVEIVWDEEEEKSQNVL